MMTQQSTMSWSLLATTVLTMFILPDGVKAGRLQDLFRPAKGDEGIILESHEATDFLRTDPTRIRRHLKWYQQNPDFQSWYKYYQKIGHNEGLYEIDRIRLTYLQMRHLENVYGKSAPYYQYTIGLAPTLGTVKGVSAPSCDPKTDKNCKSQPPAPKVPVAKPPPAPQKAQPQSPPQLSCNPHDPACLLQYFYYILANIQTGSDCDPKTDPKCSRGVRTLPCDPKHDSACAPSKPVTIPYNPMGCNPMYDPDCNEEEENREAQQPEPGPTYFEVAEDDEESEDDDEIDPYDPHYPGYYGYPGSYYDHHNPHGASPYGNPYGASSYGNPHGSSPYGNPYGASPYASPYNSPYESPYNSPYESPYNSPYASPYNSPYESPYNSPYASPYDPQYGHEDEDEDDYEDDEY
ncbi:actinodin3 [Heterodontus francisci]|uniref:actinodin3 n=1 Tax=Heterodontus francisci TaxID=7792 RepID=UPI00355B0DAC